MALEWIWIPIAISLICILVFCLWKPKIPNLPLKDPHELNSEFREVGFEGKTFLVHDKELRPRLDEVFTAIDESGNMLIVSNPKNSNTFVTIQKGDLVYDKVIPSEIAMEIKVPEVGGVQIPTFKRA